MLTLRATRIPSASAARLCLKPVKPQPAARGTMSSSQSAHRTTSSTRPPRRFALHLLRSYTTLGPGPGPVPTLAAYRSAKAVVWSLLALNTAVFATWQYARASKDTNLLQFMARNFLLSTDSIKAGRYHTALTCAFSHFELTHFAFNMFGLFTFGNLMALAGVGGFHVLAAGLGSALVGSLAGLYHQQSRQAPQPRNVWGAFGGERTRTLVQHLGASGLVMGFSATATCLMPLAPMSLFMTGIPVPLFVITAVYFGIDAYYLDRGQTRIGHAAHMGGAVSGAVYYFSYLRKYGGVWPMLRKVILRR